jgi:hypothetical protein
MSIVNLDTFDYNRTNKKFINFELISKGLDDKLQDYTITLDFAPAYELITSFYAYTHKKFVKYLDLGLDWRQRVKDGLSPSFASELENENLEVLHRINLLIWQCPGNRTPENFLNWLANQPPGDLYERLAPWLDFVPGNLGELRDRLVYLLTQWNEQYFHTFPHSILDELNKDLHAKRIATKKIPAVDLIEKATNGVRIEPSPELKQVFLVPQYHSAPSSVVDHFSGITFCLYPIESAAESQGVPSMLLHKTKALADENRLRILRFLAAKPRTFSEVQQHIKLAKSTIHHHLGILRRAGLARSHYIVDSVQLYSLRTDALDLLQAGLTDFLG